MTFEEVSCISRDSLKIPWKSDHLAISNDGTRIAGELEYEVHIYVRNNEQEWRIDKTISRPNESPEEAQFLGNDKLIVEWRNSTSLEVHPLPDGPVSRLKRVRWRSVRLLRVMVLEVLAYGKSMNDPLLVRCPCQIEGN